MAKKNLEDILHKYWGYDSFRPLQREIMESVMEGKDTIALMPTGGGKSLTYQVSALCMDGICIVITPLISLMKDQVDALRKRKILAQVVHSGMSYRDIDKVLDNCVYGDYKFLYVSPERLETDIFKARVAKMNVSMIAVDEAHCISQWGYDFRPSYLRIENIRALVPNAVVLAVTATATKEVVIDIQAKLGFKKENLFTMSFARKNLSFVVRNAEDKNSMLLKIIYSVKGVGIIYCRTRKETENVAAFLQTEGVPADFYHGGLSYMMRSTKQEAWISEKTIVMVATNAFGMGIDKSNVRFVIHYNMPDTLEAYYQEAGRAGRDGTDSYAVMLSSKNDDDSAMQILTSSFPSVKEIKYIYSLIGNHLGLAIGEGFQSVHDFNIYDFCSKFRIYSTTVLNSIHILELCGYLTLTDNIDNPTRVKFSVSRDELYRIQIERDDIDKFITILMRVYTGIFSQFVAIDEKYLSHLSGYSLSYIGDAFKKLGHLRVINYIPSKQTPLLIMQTERLSLDNIRIDANQYSVRRQRSEKRLDAIMKYKDSINCCRSLLMQRYFGEESNVACGRCDICRSQLHDARAIPKSEDVEVVIIELVSNESLSVKDLLLRIKAPALVIEHHLKKLLAEGKLKIETTGLIALV